MKVKKSAAVAFLLALGFKSAEEWDCEKIQARLGEVPERLTVDAVPQKHIDFYNKLTEAVKAKQAITVTDGEDAEPDTKAASKAKKGGAKAPKAEKKAKEPKAKKEKPAREKDALGAVVGSTRAKINAVLSKDYQSDEEIAKAAGVTQRQARLHCRRLTRQGLVEKMRRIAYRLTPAKK